MAYNTHSYIHAQSITIHCIRVHTQDYHSLLFGSGRSLASLSTHISHALCLPVSLSEVLEVNQMEGGSEVRAPFSLSYQPAGSLGQRPLPPHLQLHTL